MRVALVEFEWQAIKIVSDIIDSSNPESDIPINIIINRTIPHAAPIIFLFNTMKILF